MNTFVLPELGEGIQHADIVQVLVKPGDYVSRDQPLLEVETDKAAFEVPSPQEGVVAEILVKAGQTVAVGQKLILFDNTQKPTKPSPSSPEEHHITSAEQTDPRSQAKLNNQRNHLQSQEDSIAAEQEPSSPITNESNLPKETLRAPAERVRPVPASPSVRRQARELGVDITQVKGSGRGGRITLQDIKEYVKSALKKSTSQLAPFSPVSQPLPDFSRWGSIERKKMSKVRQATASHMSLAWSTIPMVTQFDQADVSELNRLRNKLSGQGRPELKITLTAMLLKLTAHVLNEFPVFKASLDLYKSEIIYKNYCHIGVAVDTPRGLLVPVIHDVDLKDIFTVADELNELADKARNRNIRPAEMEGSCFTITNLGGIGGTAFTPIVNPPEVAILGVSRTEIKPIFENDKFIAKPMLPLSLTYDHRLIDGADAARFLRRLCSLIEDPGILAFAK